MSLSLSRPSFFFFTLLVQSARLLLSGPQWGEHYQNAGSNPTTELRDTGRISKCLEWCIFNLHHEFTYYYGRGGGVGGACCLALRCPKGKRNLTLQAGTKYLDCIKH